MAKEKCKKCGEEISIFATKCPNCGASTVSGKDFFFGIIGLIAIAWVVGAIFSGDEGSYDEPTPSAEPTAKADDKCGSDLRCLADEYHIVAGINCEPYVERLAKYQMRWTDGFLDRKFPYKGWDHKKRTITYYGDYAEFQNQYGAWSNVVYECEFDPRLERVINVKAKQGRLPFDR